MHIAIGFNNGCGNFVVFTSVIQALASLTEDGIDLFLDAKEEDWYPTIKSFVPIIEQAKGVKRILRYPMDYQREKYDHIYMSKMNQWCWLYDEFVGSGNHRQVKHWAQSYTHELSYYYNEIAEQLDYKGMVFPMDIPMDRDATNWKEQFGKYIIVCNGYTRDPEDTMARKHYPHWSNVIAKLNHMWEDEKEPVNFVLVGGKDDAEWGEKIAEKNRNAQNLCGRTDWGETINLVYQSMVVLTCDTGVFHISDALHKEGIVLFGPTLVSKNGPLNGTMKVIRSPMPCVPCQGTICWANCMNSRDCMNVINPNLIVAAVRNLIINGIYGNL
jgi:ADP-heptose:LPS heptosyltransferase